MAELKRQPRLHIGESKGGAQPRREDNTISKRIKGEEKIEYVGSLYRTVRNMDRVLHQLLKVMEDT